MLDNLTAARDQMALSLGFHIVFAVLGVGMPWLLLFVEDHAIRTGDQTWMRLARTWSKAVGVLFAVGAVSGTVLSFEFGLLWPTFMQRFGSAFGISFTLEAFAFFIEAVFLGLYLYGWDRLSPRAHWWCGVPVALGGTLSMIFVTTANAWMNAPVGVIDRGGQMVAAEPFAPFTAPTTWPQVAHLGVAAFMCTGFAVAAVYATGLIRGRRDRYHRRGFTVGITLALALAPVQIGVGDTAIRALERSQPVKLAALEGLGTTRAGAPLSLGGWYDQKTGELRGAISLPDTMSLMLHADPDARVVGLDSVPAADRPPAAMVHLAFDIMVGIGVAFLGMLAWAIWLRYRRRRGGAGPMGSRWFLRAAVAAGPAAMVALIAGWIATEVGRQPWIVYRLMRTADAVSQAPDLDLLLYATIVLYAALATALVEALRRIARTRRASLVTGETPADQQEARA
jgi:cytochrome bd ubiquinol oxidase subunit I